MDNHYDCLIVGAGISGLFSAREILKKHPEWRIALAERYKDIGGRTFSYSYKKNTWEGGAGRISKDHKILLALINEYKLNLIPIGSDTRFKKDGAGHISLNTFDDFSKTYLLPMTYLSKDILAKHTIESLSKLMYGLSATRRLFEFFPYLETQEHLFFQSQRWVILTEPTVLKYVFLFTCMILDKQSFFPLFNCLFTSPGKKKKKTEVRRFV